MFLRLTFTIMGSAFLKDQWTRIPDMARDLTGKTVIVVGANVGLGFEGMRDRPGRIIR